MRLTIAYSEIRKRNLVLINNAAYQRETLSTHSTTLKSRNLSETSIRFELQLNAIRRIDFKIYACVKGLSMIFFFLVRNTHESFSELRKNTKKKQNPCKIAEIMTKTGF